MKRHDPTPAPRAFATPRALGLLIPALFSMLAACATPGTGSDTSPKPEPAAEGRTPPPAKAASALPAGSASPASVASPAMAALPDAGEPDSATSDASAGVAAAGEPPAEKKAEAAPYDPTNKIKPPATSEELQARAKALFEAIVKDEPALGDPFWFPKEPFIPLKDVKNPGKYWDNLHAAYAADIHKVHKKRKSWEGAKFKSFEIGSTPKWVPPGDEANKVGYHRSFRGKLRYELEGETYTIEVHTVISWQARWYITHLLKFKK